jgi:hypothetical protein
MRPTGALRDPVGCERGEPLHRLGAIRAERTLPESVDLRPFVTTIPEQRGESCIGHALAQALRVRAAIMGITLDPSAMAIYAVARELEAPGADELPDAGSYPFRAIEGLSDWGVVARRRWSDDVDASKPVAIDVLEAGATAYVTGEYAISSKGAARGIEIRQALAAGHPVFWARDVDRAYMRLRGDIYRGLTEPAVGAHAGCLVGYDADSVTDAGSWGRTHGADGFARIAWEFVESERAYSFTVITFAPTAVW